MSSPRFSILIPVWNGARYLREALDSALGQTLPPAEVIVGDNGSTDDTPKILQEYQERITTFRNSENLGSVRNFIAVAARATGDYLLWLPSDDRLHPKMLETAAAQLRQHPEAGLWFCGFHGIDDNGNVLWRRRPAAFPHRGKYPGEQLVTHLLLYGQPMTVNGTIVPRQVFEAVGGFDPQFLGACDFDLYIRIAGRYPVLVEPEPLVDTRWHKDQHSTRVRHRDNGDPDRLFAKIADYDFLSEEQRRGYVQGLCEYSRQYFSRPLRTKGVPAAEVVEQRRIILARYQRWRDSGLPYACYVRKWPRKPLGWIAWLAGATRPGVVLARMALSFHAPPDLCQPNEVTYDPGSELARRS